MDIEDIDEERSIFLKDFQCRGKCSMWFFCIVSLLIIPEITFLFVSRAILLCKSPYLKVRCKISALENHGWSFDEIQNISQPLNLGRSCSFYDYNYSIFNKMEFEEASSFVNLKPKPKLIKCFDGVAETDETYRTIYKEFNLFCKENLKHCIFLGPIFGTLFGYAIVVPLADIFGRRPVLIFGLNSFVVAAMLLNFVTVIEPFLFTRFLSGISYSAIKITSEALVIELVSPIHRPYVYFILNAWSSGITYTSLPFLCQYFHNWRQLQWIGTAGILFFPLLKWYVPESPHWFFSIEKKGKARSTLQILKQPEYLNESLLLYRNEDKTTIKHYNRHYKMLKISFTKQFLASVVLLSVTGASYLKNYIEVYDDVFKLNDHWEDFMYIWGLTDFGSFILSNLGTYLIGRKYFIVVLQVFAALEYFTLLFNLGPLGRMIIYVLLEITTSSAFHVSKLHCNENTPSSHRCTILGIYGVAYSSTTILFFSLLVHVNSTYYFIFMGISGIVGIICCCFAFPDNKKGIYDVSIRGNYDY